MKIVRGLLTDLSHLLEHNFKHSLQDILNIDSELLHYKDLYWTKVLLFGKASLNFNKTYLLLTQTSLINNFDMIFGSWWKAVEGSWSFSSIGSSCNVILILFHMTDIVCFYVKTVFMFHKTKNKQIIIKINVLISSKRFKERPFETEDFLVKTVNIFTRFCSASFYWLHW